MHEADYSSFKRLAAVLAGILLVSAIASGGDLLSGHDEFASLVAYDSSPPQNRTPLILIHGYRGTLSVTAPRPVWQNLAQFIRHWDRSELHQAYKLYLFSYASDALPIGGGDSGENLATRLRDWIDIRTAAAPGDPHQLPDAPLVIIGHSMGGLVARAMMEQTTYRHGYWRGRPGGERVLRLITLGTPHHGMPSANDSLLLGCLYRATRPAWRPLSVLTGDLFWNRGGKTAPSAPNRNELLWDNFNGAMDDCPTINAAEKNGLLPLPTRFNRNIVAYGAFLSTTEPQRPSTLNRFVRDCLDAIRVRDNRMLQRCNSVLGYEALLQPELYGVNDGFVPLSSSLFDGADIANRRVLADFDHDQVRGGVDFAPIEGSPYYELYPALADDLNAVSFRARVFPESPVRAPALVRLTPSGPIGPSSEIQWLQHDGTVLAEPSPTVDYPEPGRFPVRMILRDPSFGVIERSAEVVVLDPAINARALQPDRLGWAFQVAASSPIEEARWTFRDGSESAFGTSVVHRFSSPGFYPIQVALTLDDGTQLQGVRWVTAGSPKEVEIPPHRIGGDETWPGDTLYRVRGLVQVAEGGHLNVGEGAEVLFDADAGLLVEGSMTARETVFGPSASHAPWRGIRFEGAGASKSRLSQVAIIQTPGLSRSPLVTIQDASPELQDSLIDGSNSLHGILIQGGASVISNNEVRGPRDGAGIKITAGAPIVTGNLVTNSQVGISTEAPGEGVYLKNDLRHNDVGVAIEYSEASRNAPRFENNRFIENLVAEAEVHGRIGARIEWTDAGRYRLNGGLEIGAAGRLGIGPGIVVEITGGDALRAWGTLWAKGVRFVSADLERPWQGILLAGKGSTDSQLRDIELRDAAGSQGDSPPHAVIHIQNSAPTLSGLDLRGPGAGIGIGIEGTRPAVSGSRLATFDEGVRVWSGAPTVERMEITDNATGIRLDAAASGSYRYNYFSGNQRYAMSAPVGAVGPIDASRSFWGDRTGPLDTSDDRAEGGLYNPTGRGNRVTDGVDYAPWIGGKTVGLQRIRSLEEAPSSY